MNINFTSKNAKFTGALKAFTEKNLESIEKISGNIIDAEIIATEEKLGFKVEIIAKTNMNAYHIQDRDPILKQAVRKILNTLKTQAKKNKEKLKEEKKRVGKGTNLKGFTDAPEEEPMETPGRAPKEEIITILENYSRKPLSVEEAVFFLKDSGENAYMFTNVETNHMAVVFFNKNNTISIIEAV
ncbi:MAG: sigma 54 modulation/S30EA ribosomal C-terminal domain-containing protein [Candidatus Aminicenantes bacterium]|nr:sigma 54 modulation/S30EA ribosomal C-terminal domain-containing protein [Candidatus Aminicenantes bacterium]